MCTQITFITRAHNASAPPPPPEKTCSFRQLIGRRPGRTAPPNGEKRITLSRARALAPPSRRINEETTGNIVVEIVRLFVFIVFSNFYFFFILIEEEK